MIQNFSWILKGRLAGFGLTAAGDELTPVHLDFLLSQGVGAVVSLAERPTSQAVVASAKIRYLHLPVPDMEPPTPEQVDRFVEFVNAAGLEGLGAAVHCRAGLGRTGTMLACYLVTQGATAEEALEQVRRQRPGSVETESQEETVRLYTRSLATRRRRRA